MEETDGREGWREKKERRGRCREGAREKMKRKVMRKSRGRRRRREGGEGRLSHKSYASVYV